MLAQQRYRNDDAQLYQALAANPVFLAFAIAFTLFNVYCIYRCIRNEAWLWLILGLCLCQVFLWIGAFGTGGGQFHGGQRRRKGKTVWHRY